MTTPEDPATPSPRPLASIMAVVLLELVALGSLGLGVLLFALDGQLELGSASGVLALTAAASIAFGVLAVVGGVGMWRGRAWGWATALVVALVGLLGVAASALSSAFQPQLWIAVVLFGGLVACLLVPSVRTRSGIG
jgi:hypothetical protein